MLVDDDPSLHRFLDQYLEDAGVTALNAESGQADLIPLDWTPYIPSTGMSLPKRPILSPSPTGILRSQSRRLERDC